MSINTLESLILESYQSPESNKIYDIVENFPKYEKCQIQSYYFERLCKLPFKLESTALLYCFGKVIETLLFYKFLDLESFSPNSFIDLLNCLIHVFQKISGTNLSRSLLAHIEENMAILMKREELNEEEKNMIKDFHEDLSYKKYGILEKFEDSNDVEEILFYVKSKHIEDKICGTQKLIQFMNNTKGFDEQLELMGKKLPNIIKYIIQDGYHKDDRKMKDLLFELAKLMTTIIGEYEFFLKVEKGIFANYSRSSEENPEFLQELKKNLYVFIDGKEEIGEDSEDKKEKIPIVKHNGTISDAIVHYKIVNYEDTMRNYENIYSSIALIINTILLHPNYLELHELSFKVLSKLYIIFPKFRKNLEEPILTVLTRISENEVSEIKKDISIFLFKLTHKYAPQDFIKLLASKTNLKSFYESPYYSEKVFKSHENTIEAINPLNLVIRTVFPIERKVEAGMSYSQIIEVFHPYSIVYIGFATQYYDITFKLKLICLFSQIKNAVLKEEETLIYCKEAVIASKNPCRVIYFAKKPGLYKFEFDNSYSWMNEKCVRFKILVLEPQNLEFFMTGESIDNIVEEVKTYESLDITEQKKLVRKLSANFNKISSEASSRHVHHKESGEKSENQMQRLKAILKDSQDTQMMLQLSSENFLITIKSAKTESEWLVGMHQNDPFDLSRFYSKVNDFFKRKQSLEESEIETRNIEKQLISIVFLYDQDAMETFLRKNLKGGMGRGLRQMMGKIFRFEENLPKYFEGIYYHFIRDATLFVLMNFCCCSAAKQTNNVKNSLEQGKIYENAKTNDCEIEKNTGAEDQIEKMEQEQSPLRRTSVIDNLQKKDSLLLIKVQKTPNPVFQAFITERRQLESSLFVTSFNLSEDFSRISADFNSSFKQKFKEIFEKNESNDDFLIFLELFLYNMYLIYGEKLKLVVFWEAERSNEEGFLSGKLLEEVKKRITVRFLGKLGELCWIFERKQMKGLSEIN